MDSLEDRQFRKNIVYKTLELILMGYLGFVFSYILNLVLARAFHVAMYGDIKFGLSVMGTLSIFIALGLSVLTKKLYPLFIKRDDLSHVQAYRIWSFNILLKSSLVLWGILIILLGVVLAFEQNIWDKLGQYHVAVWFIVISPMIGLSGLVTSFMYAVNRGVASKFILSVVLKVLVTLLLLSLAALFIGGLQQYHVVFIYLFCYIVLIIVQYKYILKFSIDFKGMPKYFFRHDDEDQKNWFYLGLGFLFSQLFFVFLQTFDLVILELMTLVVPLIHNEDQVGLYAAALVVSKLFYVIQKLCFKLVLPHLTSFHEKEEGDAMINRLLARLALIALCLQLIAFVILIFFGKNILGFYGSEYVKAYPVMMVMIFGFFIRFLNGGMAGQTLVYLGHQKIYNLYTAIFVVIFIPMTFILAYFFGMMGVAISNLIIFFLHASCNRFFLAKKSIIKPLGFI